MPGGLYPSPERFGANRGRTLEVVLHALLAARGAALETSSTSTVAYAECLALARAINEAWETNQRLANQWDPLRCTDFLPRWEAIYGLRPSAGDSLQARRTALAARVAQFAQPMTSGAMQSALRSVVPTMSPTVLNGTSSTARSHVYTSVTVPGGVSIAADGMWGSSLHTITIKLTPPGTMSWNETMTNIGKVRVWFDASMPAWSKLQIVVPNSTGAFAFKCDDAHNLDFEMLT